MMTATTTAQTSAFRQKLTPRWMLASIASMLGTAVIKEETALTAESTHSLPI